jgi:hypothetical protein
MIKTKDWTSEYKITDPVVKHTSASTELSWKFQAGSHFLIFAFERNKGFSFEEIIKDVKDAKVSVEQLTTHQTIPVYVSEKLEVQVYCCDEGAYIKNKKKFNISGGRRSGVTQAHGFAIFACELIGDDLVIYKKPKDGKDENIGYVPVKVRSDVRYKKHFLRRTKTCIIRVDHIDHYDDGAVCYKVEGVRGEFPLPATCIGKNIYLEVDKDQEVQVMISQDFNKYYKKI